ncbi:hypothetical protein OG874_31120 [Nocardia sp. NBC_00565]|uniref:hypothetical protein n=1 Tax=Nocardia sp. NBC_00565 TaxID=2975993 RepID=UPI002E80E3DA|nr:hypothetical protein [Nocardia sp. NBC_00565]WUC01233.1 hypothetical protein OG874_31120 [Nocardia sp. NBC_00565]
MRFAVTSAAIFAALAATAVGAGSAAAADPIAQPDRIGLHLNHAETAALGDGPVPALFSMVVPLNRIGAGLKGDTEIYRDEDGGVHASLRQVIMEAAGHPDGTVILYVNAPGTRDGRALDIYQNWN